MYYVLRHWINLRCGACWRETLKRGLFQSQRDIIHLKFQNLVTFSFLIKTNNYQYDI